MADLEDCLVASPRLSEQLPRRPDDQALNVGDAVQATDLDAGRPQILPTGDVTDRNAARDLMFVTYCVAFIADAGKQWQRACTAPAEDHPASLARRAADGTDNGRTCECR